MRPSTIPAPAFGPADPVRATLWVIAAALALRLAMGMAIGLGTDEIYTAAISRSLSWSYFDHPPLHQWLAHSTAWLLGEGRQMRLPFIFAFALTSWLLFLLTRRLYGEDAGFWAVVALNLSGFFTLSTGSWIVPDGLLLLMLSLAAWALARRLFPEAGEAQTPLADWLIFGGALGLAGLAKYHAILAALGAAAFLIATPEGRRAFRHPGPWLGAGLAVLIALPVLLWNASNGWASFLFQAGRSQGEGFAPWLVPVSLIAQAGWLLPWVFVPLAAGLLLAWRTERDRRFWFLMALAMPSIAVFTLTPAFGNLGLPHWAMPGWFFVMPLGGLHLARLADQNGQAWRWAKLSAAGSVIALAVLASHAATGWLTRLVPSFSRSDPTLETFGWDQLKDRLPATGIADLPGRFIIADSWQNAGRADIALGGAQIVMPGTGDPRHYAFIVDQQSLLGRDAVILVRARREAGLRRALEGHFASLGPSSPIALGRSGLREIELVAIPAQRFVKPVPWPYGLKP
jgi:4-amino-4-deoxy-L-arabinose transferase-like glycosyltransferase